MAAKKSKRKAAKKTTRKVARKAEAGPKPGPKKTGRPRSPVPKAIAERLLERLAAGDSLHKIRKTKGMPAPSTVAAWALKDPVFREQYTRAYGIQADILFDALVDLVLDKKLSDGRARLLFEALRWKLARQKPKKYGDKLQLGGDEDRPPIRVNLTDSERVARLQAILAACGQRRQAAEGEDDKE